MLAALIITTLFTGAEARESVSRVHRYSSAVTDVETLARFESATREYAELHRQLARELFLDDESGEDNEAAENSLPEAIRFVRRNARQGDIFDLEVAELMRFQIRFALWTNRGITAEAFIGREAQPARPPLVVNETLRPHAGQALTPVMAELLPALPEELAYRLVGRDLVLFDPRTRVIVDVLTNALPVN